MITQISSAKRVTGGNVNSIVENDEAKRKERSSNSSALIAFIVVLIIVAILVLAGLSLFILDHRRQIVSFSQPGSKKVCSKLNEHQATKRIDDKKLAENDSCIQTPIMLKMGLKRDDKDKRSECAQQSIVALKLKTKEVGYLKLNEVSKSQIKMSKKRDGINKKYNFYDDTAVIGFRR